MCQRGAIQGQTPRVPFRHFGGLLYNLPFLCFLSIFFPCVLYIPVSVYQAALCQRRQPKCLSESSFRYIFHSETQFYSKSQCKGSVDGLWREVYELLKLFAHFCIYMHFQGVVIKLKKKKFCYPVKVKPFHFSQNCLFSSLPPSTPFLLPFFTISLLPFP